VERPHLYHLVVTLFLNNKPVHDYQTRVGFREARFELDGFFLNGRRLQLFGLNRHELYPYVGFAAPRRALRRDAEILRHSFNCNIVRCSHYPQSEAFLDACDELGLLVWEEMPGWQYIGDESWQNLALRDVEGMVRRDRNRPSIIIWGVRINESHNDPALYVRTRKIAKSLDDSRPTSGTMTAHSTSDWHQDVFAFDDYHADRDGSVGIKEPLPGVPYMLAEAVGQFDYGTGKGFGRKYRRAGDTALQMQQALVHAQAHSKAAANPHCAGVIAWCAFDYGSLMNAYEAVKYPGVADVFRIPKLGASFYLAQVDPAVRPVIEPDFYWDFGPRAPSGPGEKAAIFSNCDRLELSIDGKPRAVLHPDRAGFPNIKYPPFFADLNMDGTGKPVLHIDGYVGGALALSRSFSSDTSADRLWLHADDLELQGAGSDATGLAFAAVDKFGAPRPFVEGEVRFEIQGPGIIIGDNPFQFADSGGVGAVWIKTLSDRSGRVRVMARHTQLGQNSVEIHVGAGSNTTK
jgi:beta-galactosidase